MEASTQHPYFDGNVSAVCDCYQSFNENERSERSCDELRLDEALELFAGTASFPAEEVRPARGGVRVALHYLETGLWCAKAPRCHMEGRT